LSIPRRGVKKELVELAKKNIEATLAEDNALAELQNALDLPAVPHVIECFDVSNLGQEHVVAGMVRFADGKPDKTNYRRFRIKNVTGQDDFAAMHEAVSRRYKRLLDEKQSMPDLVVVDGGAGQVGAAHLALQSLRLKLPLIGLAKEHEEIYLPNEIVPKKFEPNSRMMLLLRQIRDATHNFAIKYNRKRRQMKMKQQFNT
jgi:excinuclease ABC subunit C